MILNPRRLTERLSTFAIVASLLFWFTFTLREHGREALFNLIDVRVYKAGAEAVLSGAPLYEPVLGPMFFVYPPFAGLVMLPMALIGDGLLKAVWLISSGLLVAWFVFTVADQTRVRNYFTPSALWKFALALTIVCWPVFATVSLGQINLIIMALVLLDFVFTREGRLKKFAGLFVGLAIALKLTPLVFLGLFLFTKRIRALLVAVATFAVTVALGFIFLPRDSVVFWTFAITDSNRMGDIQTLSNQSWRGALARHFEGNPPTTLWLLLAGLTGLVALLGAIRLSNKQQHVAAVALFGMAASAASPFSWDHHWVWMLLLLTWSVGMAIQFAGVGKRPIAALHGTIALITFLLSARYALPDQAPSGMWSLGADDPQGFWVMAYPIVGTALIVFVTVLAWLKPEFCTHQWEEPAVGELAPAGPAEAAPVDNPRTSTADGPQPRGVDG